MRADATRLGGVTIERARDVMESGQNNFRTLSVLFYSRRNEARTMDLGSYMYAPGARASGRRASEGRDGRMTPEKMGEYTQRQTNVGEYTQFTVLNCANIAHYRQILPSFKPLGYFKNPHFLHSCFYGPLQPLVNKALASLFPECAR